MKTNRFTGIRQTRHSSYRPSVGCSLEKMMHIGFLLYVLHYKCNYINLGKKDMAKLSFLAQYFKLQANILKSPKTVGFSNAIHTINYYFLQKLPYIYRGFIKF